MPGNSSVGSGYAEKRLQSYYILSIRPNSRPLFFAGTAFLLNFASILAVLRVLAGITRRGNEWLSMRYRQETMNNRSKLPVLALCLAVSLLGGCSSHYAVTGVERTRLLVDSRYDKKPDSAAWRFLLPYKRQVDSLMCPVVGTLATDMEAKRPESSLSNLLADILVWGGKAFEEHPDFAVYNMGGIRASLGKGEVTFGDIVDVAPFENKICFMTLTGDQVTALFRQIAGRGGEGVSHGVHLEITPSGRLLAATLNGDSISSAREYRVATLDYLAEGNDQLVAFKEGTRRLLPKDEGNNVRFVISEYFRECQAKGQTVESAVEGRIVVKPDNDED